MTTEYYQIPSQQGFLPLAEETADPWLAAATASLSINDWNINKEKQATNSLFEPDDLDAVSWRNVVPKQYNKPEVKAPVAPKQFFSTQLKIDAWGVVDADENTSITNKQQKKAKQQNKAQPAKQAKQQPKEEPKIEDELSIQNRYKTELCKSFTETGACRYGLKCQFAHGKEEIRSVLRHPKYKTEICKTFHTTGTCPYGIRCRFIHTRSKEEVIAMVQRQEEEEDVDDDELRLSAPPGINMPQWSKSWSMSMVPAVNNKNTHRVAVAVPEPAF